MVLVRFGEGGEEYQFERKALKDRVVKSRGQPEREAVGDAVQRSAQKRTAFQIEWLSCAGKGRILQGTSGYSSQAPDVASYRSMLSYWGGSFIIFCSSAAQGSRFTNATVCPGE